MANVVLPASTWVDLYDATGIVVGTKISRPTTLDWLQVRQNQVDQMITCL